MQIAEESSLELEQVMTMRLKEQHFMYGYYAMMTRYRM